MSNYEPCYAGSTQCQNLVSTAITVYESLIGDGIPFDIYGNPQRIVEFQKLANTVGFYKITHNTFDPAKQIIDNENWIIGRLTKAQVWSSTPDAVADYRESDQRVCHIQR
ncbi:MAG: hypothetical protein GXP08_05690 [Gammaproteobacteria bacterium]|nr:hypothetical protein [Gammaproteobacteria bacterium]